MSGAHVEATEGKHAGYPCVATSGATEYDALLVSVPRGARPADYLHNNKFVTVRWTDARRNELVPSSSVRLKEPGAAEGRRPRRAAAGGRAVDPAGIARASGARAAAGGNAAAKPAKAAAKGKAGRGKAGEDPSKKPAAKKSAAASKKRGLKSNDAGRNSKAPAKKDGKKKGGATDSSKSATAMEEVDLSLSDSDEDMDGVGARDVHKHNRFTGSTNALTFRRPAAAGGENEGVFPPTIFTDANYTRGILVPRPASTGAGGMAGEGVQNEPFAGGNAGGAQEATVEVPGDYFASGPGVHYAYGEGHGKKPLPSLTKDEALMWNHKNAAHAAAKRRFPMEAARLLGTITLHFDEKAKKGSPNALEDGGLLTLAGEYDSRYCSSGNTKPNKDDARFSRSVSKKQATGEALLEMGYPENTKPEDLPVGVQTQLERRAAVIVQQWNNVKKQQPLKECWNKSDGGFVAKESLGSADDEHAEGGYGEKHVAIECLRSWLEGDRPMWRKKKVSVSVFDRQSGKRASLYGGLREVPTDAKSVLDSLLDLGHPAHLYKVPLITPYAVARVLKDARGTRTWRVRIGVYMNRLLPEILTATTLHIIMSALDEGSYIVKEPLHTPPMRDANNPVFKSARYPVVRLPGEPGGDQEVIELLDDDDMSCDEEKKEDTDVVNAAVIGCSRESSSISPFTPRGLLKLMENTGSDISSWPEIAAKLDPYLQLDLMLHQTHAVCWMTQMESLGGYGINSMLWEEREFLDGGSIFYSPALGQIRLGRPPKTVGGCCADEMGLGKTLQMLSLIASSLDELKGEAKEGGRHHTHCTLIIVPPALAVQWCNEVKKCCGDTLKVAMLDVRNNEIETNLVLSGGHGVDILVTTYAALDKPKTASYLASFAWGRIVLDEQQEIRSSTTKIAKNCEKLDCHRRWMLSGTPIFEGIEDLRGELNFLRLEPYAANWEDGFFDFSITNHWREHSQHGLDTLRILGLLILRRSKDMTVCRTGALIMEQKKLTIEFVPVEQTASERALYCFLEYIVAQQLNQKSEDSRDNKSTQMCLRLLRQLCFSAVMMNGGLGVPSQMRTLNTLMININRQMLSEKRSETLARDHESGRSRKKQERNRRLGCDDALRYLSQHQEQAKVSDGMVTNQMVGRGQGAANRSRASGAEVKLKEAQDEVDDATKKQARARKKRAKSYWHLALEGVTTGALADQHEALGVGKKFASLWRWRNSTQHLAAEASTNLPECLRRGWRPPADFAGVLQNSTNSAFAWTQPHAFRLDSIPTQVTAEEVARSVFEAAKKEPRVRSKIESLTKKLNTAKDEKVKARLQSEIDKATASLADAIARDSVLQRPVVVADPKSPSVPAETWGAYVQVQDGDVQTLLFRVADSKAGMALQSAEAVPRVESALKSAKEAFAFAESQSLVYPCAANNKLETDARKALERAKLGLRIKGSNPSSAAAGDVLLSRALGALRGQAPDSASAMMESCQSTIESATNVVGTASALVETGRRNIARLQRAVNHSEEVSKMSAFDTLEAIKEHRFDKTQCSICLCSFDTELESEKVPADPFISMTSCGHFYCLKCLDDYAHQCMREMAPFKCPNCRGSLCPSSDVLHIDHLENDDEEKKAMRNEAKEKVREASEMLKASDGAIADGSLWHALFLAIDVPTHVSNRGHGTFTAINREVLSHMRAATGLPLDCGRQAKPEAEVVDAALSSKVQALFRDLPLGEHAVVFASSKEGVLHIEAAMKAKSIVCFSLHVGQNTAGSEDAVSKWEKSGLDSSKTGPVLIVQAGAAASGLTLTAASKMFLMEPFIRQEEEQQAYARCHRYGQQKDVCVKIYYAPVSVESRLLSWRKKAAAKMAGAGSGTNVVYQELFDADTFADDDDMDMLDEDFAMTEEGDDGEEKDEPTVEDASRTQFLLNLRPGRAAEDEEDYSDGEDDRKVSARRFILG